MHLDVIATLRRNYAAKGQVSGIGLKLATASLRHSHELCAHHNDVAATSLIEVWIDQTESRLWFLNATLNVDQA
jgi:DNA-binding ferritin-like protein